MDASPQRSKSRFLPPPATRVGAGIVVTRLLGLVRERLFAQYFGNDAVAGAFRAALRIPNAIRNLLGEGTLLASFIPVYAGLIEQGKEEEAKQLAGVIVSVLIVLTSAAALIGVVLAPLIVSAVVPGFSGETRDLTILLVKIMFPMSGLMILSAWCLGILNTHRRFFLSYAAPAMWNVAQIGTLVALGATLAGARLVIALAWGALLGAVLQLVMQLPSTLRLAGGVKWSLNIKTGGVETVFRTWIPVVVGAGVAQLSSIIDTQLGSLLSASAVAMLGYAQLLALLPISLFGVSVAASSLPELSRSAASADIEALGRRVGGGLRRITYFVIPTAFMFASVGWLVVALLFQTGRFGSSDTELVAGILAAYAIGIPGHTVVKLIASGHYALGDTKTPVKIATVTLVLSAALAIVLMRYLGVAGIALGSSLVIYLNVSWNLAKLKAKLGTMYDAPRFGDLFITLTGALFASAVSYISAEVLSGITILVTAPVSLTVFGVSYIAVTVLLGHPDARQVLKGITRRE